MVAADRIEAAGYKSSADYMPAADYTVAAGRIEAADRKNLNPDYCSCYFVTFFLSSFSSQLHLII